MPDGDASLIVRLVAGIDEIPAADWDRCAGEDNPFISHAFLSALEESGSATAETGWLPRHMVLEDAGGALLGCAPLYLKGHSMGEYVFDHGWADAFERAGGQYYPKLQSAVPFTPVTGPRLLLAPGAEMGLARHALIQGLSQAAGELGVSSLHVTFPEEAEWTAFGEAGWLQRHGQQYHWRNRGYGSFDDFLKDLNARKRKTIRRERAEVAGSGLVIETLTGDDLREEHWDAFDRFYRATSDRKWGSPYLTREFFSLLGERMADKVVLIMARDGARWVAGALNLRGTRSLYGRNWGALGHYPFLHFEACYYRAIDYAIAHELETVEAGAQGQHKVQRGYLPVRTYSAHWIADPRFRKAIADYLAREGAMVDWEIDALTAAGPFRRA